MGKLFVTAMTPVSMLWTLMESQIWISMAVCAGIAVVGWAVGSVTVIVGALFVLSVLLMRADPVAEAKAAALAART